MKYIRTKDEIIKINFEIETKLPATIGIHTEECVVGEYVGVEVIKQANTIEELCDEFVLYNKKYDSYHICSHIHKDNYGLAIYFSGEATHTYLDIELKEGNSLLGAIWTDKGLIYVAKMNEKGELELL